MEKVYLMNVGNITMYIYHSLVGSETTYLLFKEKRQNCYVTPNDAPYENANSLREIIIDFIPTRASAMKRGKLK